MTVIRQRVKMNKEDIAIGIVNYILLSLFILITLYPFYYVLILSFNQGLDATRGGIYFWPRVLTLENYQTILSDPKWINGLLISITRTLSGTVLTLFFTSLVAYGLSKRDLKFRKPYYIIFIISMYFSGGLIPYFVLLKNLQLLNNFLVYIIPGMLSIFYVLILIAFFSEIPDSLSESARIDGAGEFKIFIQIILPLSLSVLAALALFTAVGAWNEWIDCAYFIRAKELRTLSYLMMEVINKSMISASQAGINSSAAAMRSTSHTTVSIQYAAIMIAVLPIIMVYPFLQKYFIKGVLIGSVKE